MPLYDYKCREHGLFQELAVIDKAGDPCPCPQCGVLSARVVLIPPHILALAAEQRKKFAINEKAQHEPSLLSATEWGGPENKNFESKARNSCDCGSSHPFKILQPKGKMQQQLMYLPDGSKTFPSQRPWMISH